MTRKPRAQRRPGARVLVVDGDATARARASEALRQADFEPREAATGAQARRELVDFRPDLVVLEVVLPDVDGLELARLLTQSRPSTHVIFLSVRSRTEEKVAGLAVADDYLTKPVTPTELAARARAVLRRTYPEELGVLHVADLVLNERTHEVRHAGKRLALTPTEFDLLRFFMVNPGRVLSKHQILEEVWGEAFGGDPSLVETYVAYLRRKLGRHGPQLLETIRLVGYRLREPDRGRAAAGSAAAGGARSVRGRPA